MSFPELFASIPAGFIIDFWVTYYETRDLAYSSWMAGCRTVLSGGSVAVCLPVSGPVAAGCGAVGGWLSTSPCKWAYAKGAASFGKRAETEDEAWTKFEKEDLTKTGDMALTKTGLTGALAAPDDEEVYEAFLKSDYLELGN